MADDPTPDAPPDPGPDPEDADLVAYLDGELDPDDARAVEDQLTADPDTRDRAQALKKTYDLLDYLPRPEPSPDFTARTLTRLQPAASASGIALPGAAPARPGWVGPVAWLALVVAAVGAGALAHAGLRPFVEPPPKAEELALSDLRVIERLPLYLGVDDLDFARRLDDPDLFAPDPAGPPGSDHRPDAAAPNRDRLIDLFKGYPPARQQQLRRLDGQFHDLPPADRDRLDRVLEGYAVWLDRLADPDRRQVLAASTPDDRLAEVRRVREKVRQDGLSQARKDQLKVLVDTQKRAGQLEKWRGDDRTRRAEWVVARRQWDLLQRGEHKLWPFTEADLARQVDEYVRGVLKIDPARPDLSTASMRVTREEAFDLKARHDAAHRDGHWGLYGLLLYRLAQKYPGLPEPVGEPPVTEPAHLSSEQVRELRKKGINPNQEKRFSRGKWPEYALDVEATARRVGLTLDPLGPCRPGEFAGPVNAVLADLVGAKLTWQERAGLRAFEGRWPDYPQRMIALARKHDLPVPGVTLPGSPKKWQELYSLDGLKGTE